jgi:glucuronate isomerase
MKVSPMAKIKNVSAEALYQGIKNLPIISPHGHCDPSWFSLNDAFPNPSALLVTPDHYIFRMLYSQGVSLSDLGVGSGERCVDQRKVFKTFTSHWHLFLGTPSHVWMDYVLKETLQIQEELSEFTSDSIYDQIAEKLNQEDYRPRALFDRFNIEALATTDSALDDLEHHKTIKACDWDGRVIPTFRPDGVLDPGDPNFLNNLADLAQFTGNDLGNYVDYLNALLQRRAYFIAMGATATDHAIEVVHTEWLDDPDLLYQRVRKGTASMEDTRRFYGHMLIEMAQMSIEDGLTMQIHGGSRRNTNSQLLEGLGRDLGADIPVAVDWVRGLDALLNRVGNNSKLRIILFTLDETTYARELAPMAGHWPCLRIGPPWWFHDSAAGIERYFDQVVETAGYYNLAGFNDDTRAFLSIPARHDLWRRSVALHLAGQMEKGLFGRDHAEHLAQILSVDLARDVYGLNQ